MIIIVKIIIAPDDSRLFARSAPVGGQVHLPQWGVTGRDDASPGKSRGWTGHASNLDYDVDSCMVMGTAGLPR